jgi:hypothetical protein
MLFTAGIGNVTERTKNKECIGWNLSSILLKRNGAR